MQLILLILIPSLAAYAITDVFELAHQFKKWRFEKTGDAKWLTRSLRPLDCRACLSFWIALITAVAYNNAHMAALSAWAAPVLTEFIHYTLRAIKKHGE